MPELDATVSRQINLVPDQERGKCSFVDVTIDADHRRYSRYASIWRLVRRYCIGVLDQSSRDVVAGSVAQVVLTRLLFVFVWFYKVLFVCEKKRYHKYSKNKRMKPHSCFFLYGGEGGGGEGVNPKSELKKKLLYSSSDDKTLRCFSF